MIRLFAALIFIMTVLSPASVFAQARPARMPIPHAMMSAAHTHSPSGSCCDENQACGTAACGAAACGTAACAALCHAALPSAVAGFAHLARADQARSPIAPLGNGLTHAPPVPPPRA